MRFSYQWLRQWVDLDIDAMELSGKLTASGLEVDKVSPVASPFSGVCVAQITACNAHPGADKLKVCEVNAGDAQPYQVVCGAPNAAAGIKIPFARVGAELGEGFRIKKAKLRGVESFGMACSAKELGLSDDHSGLMVLPEDAPLGTDFREFLGLDDYSIDLELTPNRGDCLGIKGLARDVSASCHSTYTPLEIPSVEPTIKDRLEVALEDPSACPRYAGRVIRGLNLDAATPLWMVEALRRSGVRSISVVVDITNYVMLELGQPMHAFDFDKLDDRIIVRRGRPGEQLILLDEKEVEIDEELLTICDASGPVALAGIMGGLETGVSGNTRNVFLESAWFEPSTISGRARALGLHTDASHRFERGVDPSGQELAIERMTGLLLEIAGGQAGPLTIAESSRDVPQRKPVGLRLARLNRVLGIQLDAEEVSEILTKLGMNSSLQDGLWTVKPPANRFDIEIEEDLIEEVARIHGYDAIPAALPAGELKLRGHSEQQVALALLRESMCAAGYHEAINYSFVDSKLLDNLKLAKFSLPLANPISSDMNVMRTSLLPGLLSSLSRNTRRQQDRVRLFETGVVFKQGDSLEEAEKIAAVACGSAQAEQWGVSTRPVDFYDLKNAIENLIQLRGESAAAKFVSAEIAFLHPGQSAEISIDNKSIGWVGAIHPGILQDLDIKPAVFAFELDINRLSMREIPYANNISRFPSVRRDLAFLVPEAVSYSQVKACVAEIAGEILTDLLIFDVFSGQNVEKGYKSLAIGLILQDVSCTLTDEVVDPVMLKVIQSLESTLNAQHRG